MMPINLINNQVYNTCKRLHTNNNDISGQVSGIIISPIIIALANQKTGFRVIKIQFIFRRLIVLSIHLILLFQCLRSYYTKYYAIIVKVDRDSHFFFNDFSRG